jgi:transposase
VIVSEIGIDMSRFPTAGHLISWAGLCPKNDESAGKRRSNRMKKGAPWLKTTLSNAPGRQRTKNSYLQAQYLRIRSRAAQKSHLRRRRLHAHRRLPHAQKRHLYQDLGANHFDNRAKGKQALRLVKSA